IRPCLVAAYAAWPLKPLTPAPDDVLTIAPWPRRSMCSISCFMATNAPRRFTATRRSHSSSVISWAGLTGCSMPALLKAMSRPPKRSTVAASAASICSLLVTSHATATAWPPACSIRRAVSSTPSAAMSATTTPAPSRANARAAARPMPLVAPVTKATFPSKRLTGAPVARPGLRLGRASRGRASGDPLRVPVGQAGRHVAMRVDLREQQPRLVLDALDHVLAGGPAQRRLSGTGQLDERPSELGRVAGLRAVHRRPERVALGSRLVVVVDRQLGQRGRLGRQQFGAEEARLHDHGADPERLELAGQR